MSLEPSVVLSCAVFIELWREEIVQNKKVSFACTRKAESRDRYSDLCTLHWQSEAFLHKDMKEYENQALVQMVEETVLSGIEEA